MQRKGIDASRTIKPLTEGRRKPVGWLKVVPRAGESSFHCYFSLTPPPSSLRRVRLIFSSSLDLLPRRRALGPSGFWCNLEHWSKDAASFLPLLRGRLCAPAEAGPAILNSPRQLPAKLTAVTTIRSANSVTIRYKQPGKAGICETTRASIPAAATSI